MKKYIVIFVVSIVIGIVCIFYPFLGTTITSIKQQIVINEYNEQLSQLSSSDVSEKIKLAQEYNNKLQTNTEETETNNENNNTIQDYYNALSVGDDDVIGYITIPKIEIICPIYSEATDEQLQKGIGHISGTSLPIGGIGTHCVLSGHTGLVGNQLFTDLDKLSVGDKFYIHTLDDILAYDINQIKVVLPDNATDYIKQQSDKDYCTLVTCTPYGVNSHRLLVRGERTEYIESEDIEENTIIANNTTSSDRSNPQIDNPIIYLTAIVLLIVLLVLIITQQKQIKNL